VTRRRGRPQRELNNRRRLRIEQSGSGREFSLEGMLDSLTQRKNVTVNLNTPAQ
jgi:hypothetical protein